MKPLHWHVHLDERRVIEIIVFSHPGRNLLSPAQISSPVIWAGGFFEQKR